MNDLDRLRQEYAEREERLAGSNTYSPFNPGNLFISQGRQRATLQALRRAGCERLEGLRLLEVGCGHGGILLDLLAWGALPRQMHACDLIYPRVHAASQILPHLRLCCADGQALPYPTQAFDLVLQFTVLSSILSDEIRANIAAEILRVLRPGGLLLSYDFRFNPTNPQTRGLSRKEVRQMFSGCKIEFESLTLAPPIARWLVPWSWLLAGLIEKTGALNFHDLAVIQKKAH